MELNIEQFNPKKEELTTLVQEYSQLSIKGIDDKAGYEVVKRARINLKNKRVEIDKIGKEMRDEANKFSKLVKATADSYIGIIEPEEDRLEEEEKKYEKLLEIEKRKEDLPFRLSQLEGLGEMSDEEILSYDDKQFAVVLFEFKQAKLIKEQAELEAEKARIAEAERVKQEAERREQEEAEKIKKNEQYNQFLKENNYNENTDKIERNGQNVKIYRLVAEINIE